LKYIDTHNEKIILFTESLLAENIQEGLYINFNNVVTWLRKTVPFSPSINEVQSAVCTEIINQATTNVPKTH